MSTYGPESEGRTAIDPKTNDRFIIRNGEAVLLSRGTPKAAKTSATDEKILKEAQAGAEKERDDRYAYRHAQNHINTYRPNDLQRFADDIFLPAAGGGLLSGLGRAVGSVVYAPFRDKRDRRSREYIQSLSSNNQLEKMNSIKGAASDKDSMIARMAGIRTDGSHAENTRKYREAVRISEVRQLRAQARADWIAKHGSLTRPNGQGQSFNTHLTQREARLTQQQEARRRNTGAGRRGPPPKPSASMSGRVVIDINGNIVK